VLSIKALSARLDVLKSHTEPYKSQGLFVKIIRALIGQYTLQWTGLGRRSCWFAGWYSQLGLLVGTGCSARGLLLGLWDRDEDPFLADIDAGKVVVD